MSNAAPQHHRPLRGFTLIELLIVVAIIAILAAIAVPNFLEAQTRSKVSRARADTRTIVTGLEQYRVDNGRYPLDPIGGQAAGRTDIRNTPLLQVTTPIAYITSIPNNVFANKTDASLYSRSLYRYFAEDWKNQQLAGRPSDPLYRDVGWIYTVATSGPDGISNLGEYLVFGLETFEQKFPNGFGTIAGPTVLYDPTNGTVSNGDIVVVGPGNVQFN